MTSHTHKPPDPFANIDIYDFLDWNRWCTVNGRKCLGRASQRHHGLIGRDRRHPFLNVYINYQATCENCHTGTGEADSTENRASFYRMQCEKFGQDVVDGWIDGLPLKVKPTFIGYE
jgi:hypothetical protein